MVTNGRSALTMESALWDYQIQGASRCVVIHDPGKVTVEDIENIGEEISIQPELREDGGTGVLYIVKFGNGPQEAVTIETLTSRVGAKAAS